MKTLISFSLTASVMMLVLLAGGQLSSAYDSGAASEGKTIFTKHFQNTLFLITERAAYSLEILLDDKEYDIGRNVVGIVIHDARDEDVSGADITFILKDLITRASFTLTPAVTDRKNGLYIVSGLDLEKAGKRELVITIKKDRVEDTVKLGLPDALQDRVPKGRYSQ